MYAPSDAVNAPASEVFFPRGGGEGTWVFFGGYVPPGTPNSYPVLKKKIPLKLMPLSRNGPIFYTPNLLVSFEEIWELIHLI